MLMKYKCRLSLYISASLSILSSLLNNFIPAKQKPQRTHNFIIFILFPDLPLSAVLLLEFPAFLSNPQPAQKLRHVPKHFCCSADRISVALQAGRLKTDVVSSM